MNKILHIFCQHFPLRHLLKFLLSQIGIPQQLRQIRIALLHITFQIPAYRHGEMILFRQYALPPVQSVADIADILQKLPVYAGILSVRLAYPSPICSQNSRCLFSPHPGRHPLTSFSF